MTQLIGLVPAAGKGTRLGWSTPKELWPIRSQNDIIPVIQNTIENMAAVDVEHIIIIISPEKTPLLAYLSTVHFLSFSYVCQRASVLSGSSPGLLEAIDSAYHAIKGHTVVFGMPDTIVTPVTCYQPVVTAIASGSDLSIGLFETTTPEKFGMVDVDILSGDVFRVVDKPTPPLANMFTYMWGILAWSPQFTELLHDMKRQGAPDFTTVLNAALNICSTKAFVVPNGTYRDLGSKSDILALHKEV